MKSTIQTELCARNCERQTESFITLIEPSHLQSKKYKTLSMQRA